MSHESRRVICSNVMQDRGRALSDLRRLEADICEAMRSLKGAQGDEEALRNKAMHLRDDLNRAEIARDKAVAAHERAAAVSCSAVFCILHHCIHACHLCSNHAAYRQAVADIHAGAVKLALLCVASSLGIALNGCVGCMWVQAGKEAKRVADEAAAAAHSRLLMLQQQQESVQADIQSAQRDRERQHTLWEQDKQDLQRQHSELTNSIQVRLSWCCILNMCRPWHSFAACATCHPMFCASPGRPNAAKICQGG